MGINYLRDLELGGKRVLIRVDYNVPYDNEMRITDDTRIVATMKTLKHCMEKDARLVLVSHLGRPDGKIEPSMSLKPVAERLAKLIGKPVLFLDGVIDGALKAKVDAMKPGDVALLENIRFHPEEEANDDAFGAALASLADVYVDDAFAAAHRGHASNDAVTRHVREKAAGFLLEDEIEYFKKALLEPRRPTTAIVGGKKISTKIAAIRNILDKVDNLIIGGGMSYTFLKAQGLEIGKSIFEPDQIGTAKDIIERCAEKGVRLVLPVEIVVAPDWDGADRRKTVAVDAIPADMEGFDIGPRTVELFGQVIKASKTIVWNGPVGAFENPAFAAGTNAIAKLVAESGALSVIGGGDSVSAVKNSGYADRMSYISTGGGAFLELMEGKTLPALKALETR